MKNLLIIKEHFAKRVEIFSEALKNVKKDIKTFKRCKNVKKDFCIVLHINTEEALISIF